MKRDDTRLVGKYPDEDWFELHAATPESFFMTDVDATFTFEALVEGKSQHAARQNGMAFTARREPIAATPHRLQPDAQAPFDPKQGTSSY